MPTVPTVPTEDPGATPTATRGDIAPERWQVPRRDAVRALVERRLAALSRGDLTAWLAPVQGQEVRRGQLTIGQRLLRMRVGDLRLVGVREATPPVPAAAGTDVGWDVRASFTYRFTGFDRRPRTFDLDLTLKADPARPSSAVVTASSPSDRPQPWDLDGLVVRRSPSALVLAVGSPATVDEVVRRAATAAAHVSAVWGRVPPAVWIAPATDEDAGALLGRDPAGLAGVAAATDGPLTPGETAGADRVVIVPGPWASLQPGGRDVVMTHELTHVAVRASTTRAVPLWLSEGFAELVAYRSVDLPERTVVAQALDTVRASGLPRSLPADADFDPSTGRLPTAYGLALLALRTLDDTHGTAAVVRLYAAAAGGLAEPTSRLGDAEATTDDALADTLGTSRSVLVRDWRARLRTLLR
ncbi:hypothetical protein [Terrabacter sp. NPDC000476]|uniref:hypothetical protein n=1 Tax=Terrabacter sp. NPDC000476 TaxID=3154258 RepID=UPI00332A0578